MFMLYFTCSGKKLLQVIVYIFSMSPRIDLIGQRFSSVIVTNVSDVVSDGRKLWECLCDCGKICYFHTNKLKGTGRFPSCGCQTRNNNVTGKRNKSLERDLTGLKIGRLTVVSFAGFKQTNCDPSKSKATWNCTCNCGVEKVIPAAQLLNKSNKTLSCGCYNKEKAVTHGLSKVSGYSSHSKMIDRCYKDTDSRYHNYGGRGITVCQRWLDSVENFIEDMGERPKNHSIERLDVNGNYEPDNCVWLINTHQARNTTRSVLNEQIVNEMREYKSNATIRFIDVFNILKEKYTNITIHALYPAWQGKTWK